VYGSWAIWLTREFFRPGARGAGPILVLQNPSAPSSSGGAAGKDRPAIAKEGSRPYVDCASGQTHSRRRGIWRSVAVAIQKLQNGSHGPIEASTRMTHHSDRSSLRNSGDHPPCPRALRGLFISPGSRRQSGCRAAITCCYIATCVNIGDRQLILT
jgi:hypothetical protein